MKSKKSRQIIGIVLIVIGAIIFFIGLYAKGRVAQARGTVKQTSGYFGNNPVNKEVTGMAEKKIGSYDAPVFWTIVGGIVIVVIGIGTLVSARRK